MTLRKHMALCAAALCAMLCPGGVVLAESAGDLIAKGNVAFHGGKYDDAAAAYEKASVGAPESPYVYFDKGAVQYAKGNYAEAASLFEQAAIKTKDLRLEAMSMYNRGDCLFRESQRQRDSDLRKSLDALKDAIEQYQQALKLDPSYKNAAHNIEVSRLVMKQILDELKKREDEAKKGQQKQQDGANKLKDLIDRQQKLADKTKALQRDAPNDLQARAKDLSEEQNRLKSETEKLSKEATAPQGQSGQSASKPSEHLKAASGEQSAATKSLDSSDLDNAGKHEDKAVDEMKQALKDMGASPREAPQGGQEKEQPKQEKQAGASGDQQQQQQQQAAAPSDETAQGILQQEKEDRKQGAPTAQGGYSPVDKDW